MAKIGFKLFAWAKMLTEPANAIPTYAPGKVLGKAVSSNLAITNSEGELYANDKLSEYIKEFASANLTAEVDNIGLENQALMYGATYQNGEMRHYSDDNAPYAGVGGYCTLSVGGVRKYRAWIFPKTKATVPDEDNTTKGSSISFGTQPIDMRIMAPEFGPWKMVKEFTTEAAAKAYVETFLGLAEWYAVEVQMQGNGAGEDAAPVGTVSVAGGQPFELSITGTPTALYDNGVESKASIADGKYTLAAVSAPHKIAVIF